GIVLDGLLIFLSLMILDGGSSFYICFGSAAIHLITSGVIAFRRSDQIRKSDINFIRFGGVGLCFIAIILIFIWSLSI
ncbi:MAG: hypothetical protein KAI63_08520, partial [Planctomycetes bacterium]|nr:hypothetical protein [Planctomycetota bacterium]